MVSFHVFRRYSVIKHLLVWLGSWVAFFMMVLANEGMEEAILITTPIMLAGPPAVYANYAALTHLFEKRHYLYFAVAIIAIIVGTSLFHQGLYRIIDPDPNSHTNGLGVAILFLTMSTGFRYFRRGMTRQYREQEVRYKQVQYEAELLRSQMDPHFMFNTLNNLYALSLEQSPTVSDMILKLSDLMRYLLVTSRKHEVTIGDELDFIRAYIEFEQLRLDDSSNVSIQVLGDPSTIPIPPMLMVPFVENCFKHGDIHVNPSAHINIEIELSREQIRFYASNTFSRETPERVRIPDDRAEGIGLENLSRRLELLFPGKHTLRAWNCDRVFHAEMVLLL